MRVISIIGKYMKLSYFDILSQKNKVGRYYSDMVEEDGKCFYHGEELGSKVHYHYYTLVFLLKSYPFV